MSGECDECGEHTVDCQCNRVIKLSDSDRDYFLKTMQHPPPPNKAYKQAWKSYLNTRIDEDK
jgi:uncharacterized protein (DUF1778 family)